MSAPTTSYGNAKPARNVTLVPKAPVLEGTLQRPTQGPPPPMTARADTYQRTGRGGQYWHASDSFVRFGQVGNTNAAAAPVFVTPATTRDGRTLLQF